MLLSCRDRQWHSKRKLASMAAQPTKNRLFPQTNASMASIRTLQQALTDCSRPNVLCHQNVSFSPRISHERAFGQIVNGGSAEQNQGGFSGNDALIGMAHISPTILPNETEPKTRRFYADLNPEQERVLLKKGNHFLFAKLGYNSRESELTNKLFQQLVGLVAKAWKDRNKAFESLGHQGVRIAYDTLQVATPVTVAAAAAAATPAAEIAAGNKGRRPRVPMSEACVQTRRARLREAADILRASIDEMPGVLSMTGADGGPANADDVLNP